MGWRDRRGWSCAAEPLNYDWPRTILATLFAPTSISQMFPSGPKTMSWGPPSTGYSVNTPYRIRCINERP